VETSNVEVEVDGGVEEGTGDIFGRLHRRQRDIARREVVAVKVGVVGEHVESREVHVAGKLLSSELRSLVERHVDRCVGLNEVRRWCLRCLEIIWKWCRV
jgi:hypothetical protein